MRGIFGPAERLSVGFLHPVATVHGFRRYNVYLIAGLSFSESCSLVWNVLTTPREFMVYSSCLITKQVCHENEENHLRLTTQSKQKCKTEVAPETSGNRCRDI